MKIYFVRHGEVEEAYRGKYNGHIDIALSPKGKEEAKRVAKELSHIHFDKAYCSDLLRARESIEPFELSCEIIYTDKLREKSWGRHEGKSFEEIEAEGIAYTTFDNWIASLDGEPLEEFKQRVWSFFQEELLKQDSTNILVLTHAGFIKMLISIYEDLSLEETFSIPLPYSGFVIYDKKENSFVF